MGHADSWLPNIIADEQAVDVVDVSGSDFRNQALIRQVSSR